MEVKSEKKENKQPLFTKLAENQTYRKVIIIACLIGIALIFLSGLFKSDGSESEKKSSENEVTPQQYALQLENSLTDIVTKIQGVGNAEVLVTLERGTQYVYATEEKKSNQTTEDKSDGTVTKNEENDNSEEKYIIIKDANGGQKALAVTQVQPIIKGVVVVCDGGDNPTVQQNIVSAVTTALDISSVRVCVIKAK